MNDDEIVVPDKAEDLPRDGGLPCDAWRTRQVSLLASAVLSYSHFLHSLLFSLLSSRCDLYSTIVYSYSVVIKLIHFPAGPKVDINFKVSFTSELGRRILLSSNRSVDTPSTWTSSWTHSKETVQSYKPLANMVPKSTPNETSFSCIAIS